MMNLRNFSIASGSPAFSKAAEAVSWSRFCWGLESDPAWLSPVLGEGLESSPLGGVVAVEDATSLKPLDDPDADVDRGDASSSWPPTVSDKPCPPAKPARSDRREDDPASILVPSCWPCCCRSGGNGGNIPGVSCVTSAMYGVSPSSSCVVVNSGAFFLAEGFLSPGGGAFLSEAPVETIASSCWSMVTLLAVSSPFSSSLFLVSPQKKGITVSLTKVTGELRLACLGFFLDFRLLVSTMTNR